MVVVSEVHTKKNGRVWTEICLKKLINKQERTDEEKVTNEEYHLFLLSKVSKNKFIPKVYLLPDWTHLADLVARFTQRRKAGRKKINSFHLIPGSLSLFFITLFLVNFFYFNFSFIFINVSVMLFFF